MYNIESYSAASIRERMSEWGMKDKSGRQKRWLLGRKTNDCATKLFLSPKVKFKQHDGIKKHAIILTENLFFVSSIGNGTNADDFLLLMAISLCKTLNYTYMHVLAFCALQISSFDMKRIKTWFIFLWKEFQLEKLGFFYMTL